MTEDELRECIEIGHEIDFKYQGKWYGINYEYLDDERVYIIFYEGYNEQSIHRVHTVDELIKINYNGITVMEMLESFPDNAKADILRIF